MKFPARGWKVVTRGGNRGALCRCGEFAAFDGYVLAQQAMGHNLTRVCKCKRVIKLKGINLSTRKKHHG